MHILGYEYLQFNAFHLVMSLCQMQFIWHVTAED